jgi:L-ascorbate metabolism protein UlaG (beta-lactamase superfamily)
MSGTLRLEWLGCATFRVRVSGRTIFFDTFVDRIEAAEPVGVRSEEVQRADFLFISHTHLDHVLGADTVARNTGAPIVGSYETMRVMAGRDVPASQLWAVSGGERIDCGGGVSVRVLPGLHSCIWATQEPDSGTPCLGELDVPYQERRPRLERAVQTLHTLTPEVEAYLGAEEGRASRADGGQLTYLLTAPEGSMLVSSSSGYWSGIIRDLRPDVAVLAVAGRPNVDGEPFQGSSAQFLATEVELMRPRTVVLCHHDAWMPPLPAVDVEPIAHELASRAPQVRFAELEIAEPTEILRDHAKPQ